MNYRKFYQEYYKCSLLDDIDIHHIDGNRNNNSIENLQSVTLEEHYQIHLQQEDYGAAQAILLRIAGIDKALLAEVASKHQKYLLAEGKHNFQIMSKERRSAISKATIQKRIESGSGAFIVKDIVENSRKAGLAAAAKKAGFLDTKSENHGSKHVKGTSWWVNEQGQRLRRIESPGDGWIKGMVWKNKETQNAS
jgi:hypothetical protein